MLKAETMEYAMTYPLSSEQDLFLNKWKLRWCYTYNPIDKMPDGDERDQEDAKFWWSVETDCFTRVFGDKMKAYLEMMTMSTCPDQVKIKKEESSGEELQEESSSSEEEEEEEEPEEEEKDEIAKIDDNESSTSYSSALTTMDWGLRSHAEYQEDYWIGASGASSHMVGGDKNLFAKPPIQRKVNAANCTSMLMVCKGKMNVEALPKQDKSSKGLLTAKVAKGMLQKLFSFTTALVHDWKMYGAKKENGDIEIKLTDQH